MIALNKKRVEFLRRHYQKLKGLPRPQFSGDQVDFDRLEHADVVKVIRVVGGKWKKEKGDGTDVHYNSAGEFDGFKVRCWNGKPPPSCKIVEVEEYVPEQIIPASIRKVRKMICHPEPGAYIAAAAEKAQASPPVPDVPF